jgi:hypothetical protein
MQDDTKPKASRVNVREDQAASVTSSLYGHNLDVVGFNLTFLSQHDPALANEVLDLLRRAAKVEDRVAGTPRNVAAQPRPA